MKVQILIIILMIVTACNTQESSTDAGHQIITKDTIVKRDTVYYNSDHNWQQGFGLTNDPEVDSIWGKPVKFYIDNPNCSPIAIDFYTGQFRPTDNNTTAALLDLAVNDNHQLRPFYRWCLNKTILIQDGALAEYTGLPARRYAEKFPKEFFEYMDIDSTKEKYNEWVSSISYSGYYDKDDYKKPKDIRNRIIQVMKRNCHNCSNQLKQRIEKFAIDCFP